MCLDGRVEFIVPDYSRSAILPKHSSKTKDAKVEEVHNANCSKLLIKRPFSGNNYSIIFKRKASSNTLMHVITKMDLLKINDSSFIFQFYYAIRRRNKIIMIAGMNNKAIEIVSNQNVNNLHTYTHVCIYVAVLFTRQKYKFLCRFAKNRRLN